MARKRRGRPIHGWLVIDKPPGMTSTQVVGKVRWLFGAEKAGHGGTLDPLATGILPIALGEATKTVAYAMDGTKRYRFQACWGEERSTDDAEGAVIATSDHRPTAAEITAVLPAFTGEIEQLPPQYSAIKVDGERAYDLARAGEVFDLETRSVRIDQLTLLGCPDADHADFEVVCGKGTYMRSLARDIARALGTCGHVGALRRLSVGRFTLERAISLDELVAIEQSADRDAFLLPIETALDDIPALALTAVEAHRMRQGQSVGLLRRQDLERLEKLGAGWADGGFAVLVTSEGQPVALARLDGADLQPVRVFNI